MTDQPKIYGRERVGQLRYKNLVASALHSNFIKHVVRSAGSRKTFRQ